MVKPLVFFYRHLAKQRHIVQRGSLRPCNLALNERSLIKRHDLYSNRLSPGGHLITPELTCSHEFEQTKFTLRVLKIDNIA